MTRLMDLRDRLSSFSGTRAKALAVGRWVALNRDELVDGATPDVAAAIIGIEQTYYRVVDGTAPLSELADAFRVLRTVSS